jgi:Putative lumazine-binding
MRLIGPLKLNREKCAGKLQKRVGEFGGSTSLRVINKRNTGHRQTKKDANMKTLVKAIFITVIMPALSLQTQTAADSAAIKKTALDYVEGWYEGNPERMERALHPELAKRIVRTDQSGRSRLEQMSAMTLVQGVKRGAAKIRPSSSNKRIFSFSIFFRMPPAPKPSCPAGSITCTWPNGTANGRSST